MIEVKDLRCYLGNQWVLDGIDFSVSAQQVCTLVGASGCGKSTLLRHLMLLQIPQAGEVALFQQSIAYANPKQLAYFHRRMGVCFQAGALFSNLSVLDNIVFVLREHTQLSSAMMRDCAMLKLSMVGLPEQAAHQMPSELSGGMQKRAALARALALDPVLLLLDEPTAGLDPASSRAFDRLILQLKSSLGLTVVMVTHDVETLANIADQVIFLSQGRVLANGNYNTVKQNPLTEIQTYFGAPHGKQN